MKSTTTIECFVSKLCDLWVEGFDVLQSKMSDSKPTPEMMELLQANIKHQGKEYVTQWVKDYVLKHFVVDDTYNIIKWHTEEPKIEGEYLVCLKNGSVITDKFLVVDGLEGDWKRFNKSYVVAWCKLSNIKPYKEDKK